MLKVLNVVHGIMALSGKGWCGKGWKIKKRGEFLGRIFKADWHMEIMAQGGFF